MELVPDFLKRNTDPGPIISAKQEMTTWQLQQWCFLCREIMNFGGVGYEEGSGNVREPSSLLLKTSLLNCWKGFVWKIMHNACTSTLTKQVNNMLSQITILEAKEFKFAPTLRCPLINKKYTGESGDRCNTQVYYAATTQLTHQIIA